jgi:hypothetical protein
MIEKYQTRCFRNLFQTSPANRVRSLLLQAVLGVILLSASSPFCLANEPLPAADPVQPSRTQDMNQLPSTAQRHYGYWATAPRSPW